MSETFAQYHVCPDRGDCPICGVSPNPMNFQSYQPEMKTVKKDYICLAIRCIENGLEYANECAITHEISLGRTTLKNRLWAERMEKDIAEMKEALENLRKV